MSHTLHNTFAALQNIAHTQLFVPWQPFNVPLLAYHTPKENLLSIFKHSSLRIPSVQSLHADQRKGKGQAILHILSVRTSMRCTATTFFCIPIMLTAQRGNYYARIELLQPSRCSQQNPVICPIRLLILVSDLDALLRKDLKLKYRVQKESEKKIFCSSWNANHKLEIEYTIKCRPLAC